MAEPCPGSGISQEGGMLVQGAFDGKRQTAAGVMVVPPVHFRFDDETAGSNSFQKRPDELGISAKDITDLALVEYSTMVDTLRAQGIRVDELPGSPNGAACPDAVFPNNWFSLHEGPDGAAVLILYPMAAEARRRERQPTAVIDRLPEDIKKGLSIIDCTGWEKAGEYLEGTGSLVLDRLNRIAYAAESPRTVRSAVEKWCSIAGYRPMHFKAVDKDGIAIYHTNVVMGIGTDSPFPPDTHPPSPIQCSQ